MKMIRKLSRLLCAFAVCLLAFFLLPAAANAVWHEKDESVTNVAVWVYAQGDPLIILDKGYCVDTNRNGVVDAGETTVMLDVPNLRMFRIYGGDKSGTTSYDTWITVDSDNLTSVHSGNYSGTHTGNATIYVKGGEDFTLYGGNNDGTYIGNTDMIINGGSQIQIVGATKTYTGNVNVTLNEGEIFSIDLAGTSTSTVLNGDAKMTVNGGTVERLWMTRYGTTDGNITLQINDGTVKELNLSGYGGSVSGDIYVLATGGKVKALHQETPVKPLTYTKGITAVVLDSKGSTFKGVPKATLKNFLARKENDDWMMMGEVTIPAGAVLTIPEGTTLTIPADGELINYGLIRLAGDVVGEITNHGVITCVAHKYNTSGVCERCGSNAGMCALNNGSSHSFVYSKEGVTITQSCSRDCGHKAAAQLTVTTPQLVGTAFQKASMTVNNGWAGDKPVITHSYEKTDIPGSIEVRMTAGGSNVQTAIGIEYLPLPENPYAVKDATYYNGVYWYRSGDELTVLAPEGYKICCGSDAVLAGEPSFADEYKCKIEDYNEDDFSFQLMRESDGALTEPAEFAEVRWDSTAPKGNIRMANGTQWESALSPSMRLFYKGSQSLQIHGEDTGSGVTAIEYHIAQSQQTDVEALDYIPYDGSSISLSKGKHVVYVRISDGAGNVTYINSDGIVIYEDATTSMEKASRKFAAGKDLEIPVVLRGNTVAEVKVGDRTLLHNTDYTVTAEGILLDAALLDSLGAGEYTLQISVNPLAETYFDGMPYNQPPASLRITLEIEKMPMMEVACPSVNTLTYTGTRQYLITRNETIAGIYEYALGTDSTTAPTTGWSPIAPRAMDVGKYCIWFRAAPQDAENYLSVVATYVGDAQIKKASAPNIELPQPTNDITYGQPLQDVILSRNSNAYGTFKWFMPEQVLDAGSWSRQVYFTPSDAALRNYDWSTIPNTSWEEGNRRLSYQVTVTVLKADVDYTAPTANTLTYNAQPQELLTAGTCLQGALEYSLEENGTYTAAIPTATNAGEYTLWYRAAPNVHNENNYKASEPQSITVTISKAVPVLTDVAAEDVKNTTDLAAVIVSYRVRDWETGMLVLEDGQALSLGENTLRYTFIPGDTDNLLETSGEVTVSVLDTIAPTGTVSIAANTWDAFLNAITFGAYYPESQTLTVSAEDSFSGVDKVAYAESDKGLTLEEVKALTDWTQMSGPVTIPAEDAKTFVYYIRITDKAGNIAYLSSDGAEFDTTAPQITGVDNGVTYYTTQGVAVADKNLDAVTLNGEAVTGDLTLAGNKEATYIIVATDKAGNSTTVTVQMVPIAKLAENLEGKTTGNVKPEDKAMLNTLIDTVEKLLQEEDATEEEKAELAAIQANAESLLKAIKSKVPATGDSSQLLLWIVILAVSISAIVVVVVMMRKTKHRK